LAPAGALPKLLHRLTGELHAAGIEVPPAEQRFRRHKDSIGFAGLRRLDLTVDLRADTTHEGREVLAAVEAAAAQSPYHSPTYGRATKPGRTVYIAGDGGYLGRWYDKGAESGQAPPFRRIRPEAQWRFASERAAGSIELGDVEWMRDRFARRWGPWMRGRIVVGDMSDLGRELSRAVREGKLSPGEARRIAGYLVMEPYGLDGVPGRTARRLRAEAGKFGFRLVNGVLEPVEVDLGAVLAEAERLDLWESGSVSMNELPDDEEAGIRQRMREQLDARRPDTVKAAPGRKPPGRPSAG
jgi:hypothetical protein